MHERHVGSNAPFLKIASRGKLFKLMESLAIEKCHGTFEDSDYKGDTFRHDSGVPAYGRMTLNINYWLGADRT